MDDPQPVRFGEAPRAAASANSADPPGRRPGGAVEPAIQAAALDILQSSKYGPAGRVADMADLNDVGVLHAGDGLGLDPGSE